MGIDSCPGADCLQNCSECWVTCVTVVAIILGCVLFVAGIFILLATTVLASSLDSLIQSTIGSTFSAFSSTAISSTTLFAGLMTVAIAFIIVGAGLVIFSAIGCSGTCEKKMCCTAFYTAFWGCLIIVELIIVIWYATNQTYWISALNQSAIDNINNYYVDIYQSNMNTWSLTWNAMMNKQQCCGYSNYTDFNSSTLWNSRLNVTCQGALYTQAIPVACCPCSGDFPKLVPNDLCCLAKPNSTNSYISTPCFNAMQDSFYAAYGYVVGLGTGIGCLEILFFLLLVFLTIRYNKVDAKKA